jgi:hypothetical protein
MDDIPLSPPVNAIVDAVAALRRAPLWKKRTRWLPANLPSSSVMRKLGLKLPDSFP